MRVNFTDKITLTDRRRTPEGYLAARAVLSRTGIQVYTRNECGLKDGDPKAPVRLYRPPEEVFSKESLDSFAMKPVTDDHPPVLLDTSNIKQYQCGFSGSNITHDAETVSGDLLITDVTLIKKVEDGKSETSNGYETELDWTPGTTPKGENYDGVQRTIRGNHIAIVDLGRCGPTCRLKDAAAVTCDCASCKAKEQPAMTDTNKSLSTVTVDSLSVETAGNGAQIIQKAIGDRDRRIADLETQLAAEKTARAADAATAKTALDKMTAERDDAKTKIPDAKTLHAQAAALANVVADAKRIAPTLTVDATKSAAEIRRAACELKLGAEVVKDKSDDYIAARFDALKADAGGTDQVVDAYSQADFGTAGAGQAGDSRKAYDEHLKGLGNAWQHPADTKH